MDSLYNMLGIVHKSAIIFAPLHTPPKHISIMTYDFFFTPHTKTQLDVMKILSTLKLCLCLISKYIFLIIVYLYWGKVFLKILIYIY